LRAGQPSSPNRVWGDLEELQQIRPGQVNEGGQRAREVLPQRRAQPQHLALPVPNQILVRPRRNLDALDQCRVTGHRPQLMSVGAHHVRQRVRVPGVALGTRGGVPLTVTSQLTGVDRVHDVTGGDQRSHPRPAISLDPHHDLLRGQLLAAQLADQLMHPSKPGHPFRHPQPAPALVLNL